MEVFQDLVAEPRADMSDIAPCVVFPHGEDQGAEERPGALGRREARDHHFLLLCCLDRQQSAVRLPEAYALSARFAMTPSRPFRSTSAKNFVPFALR